jgi:LysR family pca operon transcriptional activator
MNISRIKMRHLHCLVVVGQERSMLKAADRLALTQPAVSKTISELEEVVGRPLLVRHPRGVDLTAAGEVLLQYAGASLRSLREGLDAAMGTPLSQQESVFVGALPTVAATLLPEAVAALRTVIPNLHVHVASGTNAQLMGRLRQGELDLVFGRLAEPSDMLGLAFEHLYSEELVAAARPAHPLARARKVHPGDLARYPLVLPTPGTAIRRTIDEFFVTHRVAMPACVLDTLETVFALQVVRCSDAVWVLPAGLHAGLRSLELVRLRLDTSDTVGPVGLTTRRDAALSAGAQALRDALRKAARQQPAR